MPGSSWSFKTTSTWDPGAETLTVADDGIGIPDTEVIWQEGPTSRLAPEHAAGRGMGLAIVKRKVETIGWKISVVSAPGRGSVFTLTPPEGAIITKK